MFVTISNVTSENGTNVTAQAPSADCELFPDDPHYCDAILWCKYVFSLLSIFGCIFTLFVIWLFKKYTALSQRLIANLSGASLLVAAVYMFNKLPDVPKYAKILFLMMTLLNVLGKIAWSELGHKSIAFCKFQGACLQFGMWSVMLWYMCIVYNLLSNAVLEKSAENLEKLFLSICWGFPLLMAGIPFADDVYGEAGSWCWIKNDWKWRFGTWYIWSIISILLVLVLMVWILYVLHRKSTFQSDIKSLRLYPVVYFLVNVFPVVNRLQNAIKNFKDEEGYVFPLLLLQTISGPLLGVANAVVFVLDRPTVDSISWTSFKMALQRRFEKDAVIREYPVKDFEINIVRNDSIKL